MNNKYYTLGLGSGIILCALIMYIALLLTDVEKEKIDIDDEYIVNRAVELGMIFPTNENENENENDGIDSLNHGNSNEDNEQLNNSAEILQDDDLESNIDLAEIVEENVEFVTFTVEAGSSSYAVSKTLFEEGLVDDENSFNQYLINNDINTKIRTGTFRIKKGSSYSEVAGYLTGQ